MGDFGTTFDSSPCDSLASTAIPIRIADPTVSSVVKHSHHHHHHHGHNQHHHDHHGQPRLHPVTLHLNPSNGTYPTELASLLRHIVEHSGSRRAEVLRDLRRLLKKTGGHLPDVDRTEFFEAFYPMLADVRWKVVCEVTMLIVDIIPQMGDHDLDHCMAIILPRVIPNLGHEATDVRRASLRLLHVYMRYTNNLQKVLRLYIQYGLESHDKSAQKGCVLSLPLLFTEEFSKENLFPLVQSLGHLLVHSDASLFYPIFLAMQRLHNLVGNETFRLYLQHLSPETVSLYNKVLSRASTADSSGRPIEKQGQQEVNDTVNAHDDTTELTLNESESTIQLEKLLISNDISKNFDSYSNMTAVEDDETNLDSSIQHEPAQSQHQYNHHHHQHQQHQQQHQQQQQQQQQQEQQPQQIKDLTKNCEDLSRTLSEPRNVFDTEYVLVYGIFPIAVHNRSSSTKMAEKIEGLSQMISILREAPDSHIAGLVQYLPSFLENFIASLVEHPNFKVTLIGLEMIELIVERLGLTAYTSLESVIDILLKRLGDGRSVVREQDIKVIHRLMLHWPPQNVLNMLLKQKFHRNPKIREEIVNRVTFALLMFPRTEFNLHRLSYEIATMLIDPKRQVRLAALESVAVIAQALGPTRLEALLSTVSAIEQTSESEGLLNAVQARLSRRDLPRCNSDGSLRYVLNVSNFSGWFPSTSEADIEWVLLASASHTGTPPKIPTNHYLGRFNEQYRRYSLKQAEAEGFHIIDKSHGESEQTSDPDDSVQLETLNTTHLEPTSFQERISHENNQNMSSSVSSDGDEKSQRSDDSAKSRDLWRYYFMRFKQHLAVATCSSASSAMSSRSKTADWSKKLEPELDKDSRRSSLSQLADTCDLGNVGCRLDDGDLMRRSFNEASIGNVGLNESGRRDTRALSMPSIISGGLSDISEQSREDFIPQSILLNKTGSRSHLNETGAEMFYPVRRKSVNISGYPRSVPTSPEKRNSFQTELSDFEISFERPRSAMKTSPINPILDESTSQYHRHHQHELTLTTTNTTSATVLQHSGELESSLEITKAGDQISRRVSVAMDTNRDGLRTTDDSEKIQETTINSQRQSILPSVSIDEATEPEDSGSDGNVEGNLINQQCLPNQEMTDNNDDRSSKDNRENDDQHHPNQLQSQHEQFQQHQENDNNCNKDKDEMPHHDEDRDDNEIIKDGSEVSSSSSSKVGDEGDVADNDNHHDDSHHQQPTIGTIDGKPKSRTPGMKRRPMIPIRKRASRSISPVSRQPQYHMIRIQPAIPPNANIRLIMENVVKTEGPFDNPEEALRAALAAFGEEAWTTKVEGMLAVTRLASFHPSVLQKDFHSIIVALVDEVKNLRSSVSRSAIFTLGDLFIKMKRSIEQEIELIGCALINKCSENASFIREDCERALMSMIDEMPQVKSALVLVHWGANHRNMNVRRTAAHFLSILVERMGPVKCLLGPKDIGQHLLQSSAKFLMDGSPHTRYYGRKIFSILLNHNQFDKLLRKHVTPGTYRNICGILESIKRRGIGEKPADLTTPVKP